MIATSYEIVLDAEWRVAFGNARFMFSEHPEARAAILTWIENNITGEQGRDWRISSYSVPPYAAFISEEDALMCFLAFQ
jgi:hypothetical protein